MAINECISEQMAAGWNRGGLLSSSEAAAGVNVKRKSDSSSSNRSKIRQIEKEVTLLHQKID